MHGICPGFVLFSRHLLKTHAEPPSARASSATAAALFRTSEFGVHRKMPEGVDHGVRVRDAAGHGLVVGFYVIVSG